MNQQEYNDFKASNRFLAFILSTLHDANPDTLEIIEPSANPKYEELVKKIGLTSQPTLAIVDDAPTEDYEGVRAAYHAIPNAIVIKRSTYEQFCSKHPKATYVVAHELGHGKFAQTETRRNFLARYVPLTIGLGVGMATRGVASFVANPERSDERQSWKRYLSNGAGVVTGLVTGVVTKKIFIRMEEFAVDQLTTQILLPEDMIRGIGHDFEELFEKSGKGAEYRQLRKNFDEEFKRYKSKKGVQLNANQREVSWLLYAAKATEQDLGITESVWQKPTDVGRINHLAANVTDPKIMR